ncbi:cytochrome c oxidase subunit 3 family protein [Nocardia wallacei]|uniref:Cytochrome aa3 subunit 3 n=1 Tax=Nocardia wallacei TaxID=480035 RepID=A0A7G1KD80_9NOCA|nr:cytochrome c oxidase subunit 3 family protein [Nocardia wallacei]BCK52975.1 cytochrome c oxidase subunit III [Nocardia wallacei]
MTKSDSLPAAPVRGHLPGDGHMWVMVLGDMVIFGGYFVIFMIYRTMAPGEFLAAQQHLDVDIGVVNTIVLLTSSWFVALSVLAARAGRPERAIRLVYACGCCGALFVLLKAYEWAHEIAEGRTNSELFYSFYYVLTGVHLLHVAIGLIVLGVVVRELRDPARRRVPMVESGAIYWHMVDLLWVVIFALLYVMR